MNCIEHRSPYLDDAVPGIVKAVKAEPADKPAASKGNYKELVRNAIK